MGVLRVQLLAPTVLVTRVGTVPPKACTVPKLMDTADVPLPVRVIPLGSVTMVKATTWAELRQLHSKIAITIRQKRCNSLLLAFNSVVRARLQIPLTVNSQSL